MMQPMNAGPAGYDGIEKRETQRFVLLLRPAKIIARSGEYVCILRDVAAKGMRLKLFHPLPADPYMVLELGNGDRYEVEKIWERDDQAGFSFRYPAELKHLLEERSRVRKRPLRLRVNVPSRFTLNGETWPCDLLSLSQQGGGIACEALVALDQLATLEIPGLPPIETKVRWRRGAGIGLVFEKTFRLDELAAVALRLQPFGPAIPSEEEEFLARVRAGAAR